MTMEEACQKVEAAFSPLFPRVYRRRVDDGAVFVIGMPGREQADRKAAAISLVEIDGFSGLDVKLSEAVADIRSTDARWL